MYTVLRAKHLRIRSCTQEKLRTPQLHHEVNAKCPRNLDYSGGKVQQWVSSRAFVLVIEGKCERSTDPEVPKEDNFIERSNSREGEFTLYDGHDDSRV